MAKVPFSKLKCKINEEVKQVKLNDEITIEVKQYLPIQDKLALIGKVVEYAHEEDSNYSNPVKLAIITDVEIIKAYTNLVFTNKQLEDIAKFYDLIKSSGIVDLVIEGMNKVEYELLITGIRDTIASAYAYQNSVLGILDTIQQDYSRTTLDVNALQKLFKDTQNFDLLEAILTNDYQ